MAEIRNRIEIIPSIIIYAGLTASAIAAYSPICPIREYMIPMNMAKDRTADVT